MRETSNLAAEDPLQGAHSCSRGVHRDHGAFVIVDFLPGGGSELVENNFEVFHILPLSPDKNQCVICVLQNGNCKSGAVG